MRSRCTVSEWIWGNHCWKYTFSVFHSVPVIMVLCVQYCYYLLRSTVVTLKTTPFSQRIIKRRCENGQFPMVSPSLPAWLHTNQRHGSIFKSNCALKMPFFPPNRFDYYNDLPTDAWHLTSVQVLNHSNDSWSWRFCQHTQSYNWYMIQYSNINACTVFVLEFVRSHSWNWTL